MDYIKTTYENHKYTNYPNDLIFYLMKKYYIPISSSNENTAIDIGCGRGEFSRALSFYFSNVISYDKFFCKEYHDDLNFKGHNIEDGFYYSGKCDFIFMKSVIEHIYNPNNLISSCYNALDKNGMIILLTPNYTTQKNIFYDDPTHVHPYTLRSQYDLLKMHKFYITENCEFFQLPIVWRNPWMKLLCKIIQLCVKPEYYIKHKFIRWSSETMILTVGQK